LDSPSAVGARSSPLMRGLQNIDNEAQQYLQPPVSRPFETTNQDASSTRNIRRRLERDASSPRLNNDMDIDTLPPAIQLARAKEAQINEYSSYMEGNNYIIRIHEYFRFVNSLL
jgi:hypothetical protein